MMTARERARLMKLTRELDQHEDSDEKDRIAWIDYHNGTFAPGRPRLLRSQEPPAFASWTHADQYKQGAL